MIDPFRWIADILIYGALGLPQGEHLADALHFFVMDVGKIFFMLVAIIYLMGWFRALVSPEKVRNFIRGRSKFAARGMACGLGAVTPFCSCSSVPLFIGFVEAGIPLGVTFSFLITSPMINEVAVVLLASILGWKLAALYVAAGLTVGFVGGIVMERFKPEKWVEAYVWKIQMGEAGEQTVDNSLRGRHLYAWGETAAIVKRIWTWVLLGIGVGALFHGYVPVDLAQNLGNGLFSVPAAVLMGVPLYNSAIGAIPVAEAMLLKGVGLGTTLAFMMSVAALSVPEMLILRKVVRWPALGLFCLVLTCAFILVGFGFNGLDSLLHFSRGA